jgi:hypothetical protein
MTWITLRPQSPELNLLRPSLKSHANMIRMGEERGSLQPKVKTEPILIYAALRRLRDSFDDAELGKTVDIHPHLDRGATYQQDAASWMAVSLLLAECHYLPQSVLEDLMAQVSKGMPDATLF